MTTESVPLEEVRLEELLRILEFKKSCSSLRREKFQTKLRNLKEKQDCLQQRIVTRLNKDGVNIDIDTLRRRTRQAALFAAQSLETEDENTPDLKERAESNVPLDISEESGEYKADEHEVLVDEKVEEVPTKDVEDKSGKQSAKCTSEIINKKLEQIQEESTDVQAVSKAETKEKKPSVKGTKRAGEKRFKKVAHATKFVNNVSKRKTPTSQKLKESK